MHGTNIPWYIHQKRLYLLDFQLPDPEDQAIIGQPPPLIAWNAREVTRQLRDAGVQGVYMHAKDNQGNCYYNTLVGHKHSALGDRDLVKEFTEELHRNDMLALYYVQLSRERRSSLHPMHQARRADGSHHILANEAPYMPSDEGSQVACLNGPHRDYILAIVRELTENYDVDGYWFDCFGWWGRVNPCYCEFCRAKYIEDTGLPLPDEKDKTSDAWRRYLAWRRRLNTLILGEVVQTVKSRKPWVTVTHNGSAHAFFFQEAISDCDDYVSHEFHYNDGHGWLSQECKELAALKPGRPFEVEVWRFFNRVNNMSRGYQVRTRAALLTEMYTVLAHGGLVQYYDQVNPDGTLDGRSIAVMKECFDEVKKREEWFVGYTPTAYAAIMWSKETEAFAQPEQAKIHAEDREGFHHALIERHLPVQIVTGRGLHLPSLAEFKAVVLPSTICLSAADVASLDAYVRHGGGLVVTYRSSLADERGRPQENMLLCDLLGVDYLEPLGYLYSYIQMEAKHPIAGNLTLGWPMSVWEAPQVKVAVRDGEAIARIVKPMRGFPMGHPPLEVSDHPAIVVRTHGKGRVVYFASPIGAVYSRYGHPDNKAMIAEAVRWAAGINPVVTVEAAATVEAMITEKPDSEVTVVHLVNRTAAGPVRMRAAVIEEALPAVDVRVHIASSKRPAKVHLQPGQVEPKLVGQGPWTVTIPRVDLHTAVVIQW